MKVMGIEALLNWTYCHELPKLQAGSDAGSAVDAYGSTWAMVVEVAALGTIVDRTGAAPSYQEALRPAPHADALRVHDAVLGLADTQLDMPDGFDAMGDCRGLTDAELQDAHARGFDIATAKRDRLSALVMRRALVGDTPPWRNHGPIFRRPFRAANGRERWFRMVNASAGPGRPAAPQEVDGFNAKTHRPYTGAYRRFYLDPCPSLLIAERIEYQAWVLALHRLVEVLHGELVEHHAAPPVAPLWPWEGEEPRSGPRVLPALRSTASCEETRRTA